MEVNIPENLEDLKRPALQKLCKRLGLKANGKVQTFVTFSRNIWCHTEACVHGWGDIPNSSLPLHDSKTRVWCSFTSLVPRPFYSWDEERMVPEIWLGRWTSLAGQSLTQESLVKSHQAFVCILSSRAPNEVGVNINWDVFCKGRSSVIMPRSLKQHANRAPPFVTNPINMPRNSWRVRNEEDDRNLTRLSSHVRVWPARLQVNRISSAILSNWSRISFTYLKQRSVVFQPCFRTPVWIDQMLFCVLHLKKLCRIE